MNLSNSQAILTFRVGFLTGLTLLMLAAAQVEGQEASVLADWGIDALHYEAAAGCPDRESFLRRAREHLGSVPATPAREARQLRVRLRGLGQGAAGQLTLLAGDQVTARRALEAADCRQAADALALVLALTLEPTERPAPPPVAAPTPTTPEGRRARAANRGVRGVPQPRHTSPPAAETGSPSSADPGVPIEVPSPSPRSAPAPREKAQATPATAPAAPSEPSPMVAASSEPEKQVRSVRLGILGAAGAVSGVLPSWRPLFGGSLRVSWAFPTSLGVSLRAGMRLAVGESVRVAAGSADFRWYTSDMAACIGWLPGALDVRACADAEVGRLTVHGRNTRNPRRSGRPWTALGPSLVVGWRLIPSLSLQLAGGALWPFTRDRYFLAEERLHRPARVGARVELGVELSFP